MQDDLYTVLIPPVNDPLRLVDVKNFLRIENDRDDILIRSLIKTSINQAESYTGRIFAQRTLNGKFSNLISRQTESHPFVQINIAPLISITNIKVMSNSVLTVVPITDYFLKQDSGYSRVLFSTVPSAVDIHVAYPLEIEFVAGYATIPDDILVALQEHILFLYENRGDVIPDGANFIPLVVRSIYSKYRILDVFG